MQTKLNIASRCTSPMYGRYLKGMSSHVPRSRSRRLFVANDVARYRQDIKIVPIVVGAISAESEGEYGALLAPYLAREDTFCVVSSDFCHWLVPKIVHVAVTDPNAFARALEQGLPILLHVLLPRPYSKHIRN